MQNVTVLIIAYNARATIERALDSAFSQVDNVILVDDFSSDGTAEFAQSVASGSLKVIRNPENLGTGGSRQVAVDNCESEFAIWLDADDMFLPGRVKHSLAILNAGADYVFDSAELYGGISDKFTKLLPVPEFLFEHGGLAYQIERNYVPSLGWGAVRTQVVKTVGYGLSLRGTEDYDHFLRALIAGYDIKFSHEANYRQYAYPNSVSRDVKKMNDYTLASLATLEDGLVRAYLDHSGLHPAEVEWIWCNYLVRQGRYTDLLNATMEFEAMINGYKDECLKSAPLPYSFLWKLTFAKGIALFNLNLLPKAEQAFMKLNEITLTPEGSNNLGVVRAKMGKSKDSCFSVALTLKSNYLDALKNINEEGLFITQTPLRIQASRDDYE